MQYPAILKHNQINTRCVLSHLRCNGYRLLLSSFLFRIGRIENSSCSVCGHSSQNTSHLILYGPASDSLQRSFFGDSLSLHDLWSRLWRVARLLRLHDLPPCLHPSERVGYQQQHQINKQIKTINCQEKVANWNFTLGNGRNLPRHLVNASIFLFL